MPRFALIVLLVGVAWADRVDPPYENHLVGTGPQGTAGAVIVGARGTEALFANPAGRRGEAVQACAGLLSLPCQRRVGWAGVVVPKASWAFSAAWGSAFVSDLSLRGEEGSLTGTTSWRRHRVGIGVARSLDYLNHVGVDLHYLRVDAAGAEANGFGMDIGVVRLILPPLLAVGGAVNDALSTLAYSGGAVRRETIRPRLTGGIRIGLAEGKVQMEWDLYRRVDWKRWRALVGLQAAIGHGLTARIGYGGGGMAAGVGLSSGHIGFGFAMIPDELGGSGRGVEAIWTR